MKSLLCICFAIVLLSPISKAGVFFDDEAGTTSSEESSSSSSGVSKTKSKKKLVSKTAATGSELRKMRRAALGAQAMGQLGMGGILMELNFTDKWGFGAGYGGGEGFQAYMVQAKYVLSGDWLMPYFNFGYASWYSIGTGGSIGKTKPSILAERLLTDEEKAEGRYRKQILYPAFGLQFMQLDGEYAGFSIFAELEMLLDVANFVAAPTGSLGLMYYF